MPLVRCQNWLSTKYIHLYLIWVLRKGASNQVLGGGCRLMKNSWFARRVYQWNIVGETLLPSVPPNNSLVLVSEPWRSWSSLSASSGVFDVKLMLCFLFQRVIYQCTYRGCGEHHLTVRSIEAHVRKEHLLKDHPDRPLEDGEEDFYYEEVKSHTSSI